MLIVRTQSRNLSPVVLLTAAIAALLWLLTSGCVAAATVEVRISPSKNWSRSYSQHHSHSSRRRLTTHVPAYRESHRVQSYHPRHGPEVSAAGRVQSYHGEGSDWRQRYRNQYQVRVLPPAYSSRIVEVEPVPIVSTVTIMNTYDAIMCIEVSGRPSTCIRSGTTASISYSASQGADGEESSILVRASFYQQSSSRTPVCVTDMDLPVRQYDQEWQPECSGDDE
jgi:hypothetical protein